MCAEESDVGNSYITLVLAWQDSEGIVDGSVYYKVDILSFL